MITRVTNQANGQQRVGEDAFLIYEHSWTLPARESVGVAHSCCQALRA